MYDGQSESVCHALLRYANCGPNAIQEGEILDNHIYFSDQLSQNEGDMCGIHSFLVLANVVRAKQNAQSPGDACLIFISVNVTSAVMVRGTDTIKSESCANVI